MKTKKGKLWQRVSSLPSFPLSMPVPESLHKEYEQVDSEKYDWKSDQEQPCPRCEEYTPGHPQQDTIWQVFVCPACGHRWEGH
jgi:hypothetical protein